MLNKIKSFFKKDQPPETPQPLAQEFYEISQEELNWLVDKVKYNRRKYEAYFALINNGALSSWKELAALHYILFRSNFGKLDLVKPSALTNYSEHYYFKAGLKLLGALNELN